MRTHGRLLLLLLLLAAATVEAAEAPRLRAAATASATMTILAAPTLQVALPSFITLGPTRTAGARVDTSGTSADFWLEVLPASPTGDLRVESSGRSFGVHASPAAAGRVAMPVRVTYHQY